ncbi:hypothetical protein [Streptomyces sp. NPDC003943]
MTSQEPLRDEELWQACVDAQKKLAHRQSLFFRQAKSKTEVLRSALSADSWQRAAALAYLGELHADPTLLPQLADLAMSPGWALKARQAIVNIPREQLFPCLEELLAAHLPQLTDGDDDYYSRWAELLVHAEAWALLAQVVKAARRSSNPDVRQVASWVNESYGALIADALDTLPSLSESGSSVPSNQEAS